MDIKLNHFLYAKEKYDIKTIFLICCIIFLEWFIFTSYVFREVAWSPFVNGDATAYLGHSYLVFDSILKGNGIPQEFIEGPHGIGLLIVSFFLYLIFGASRVTALAPNLVFYLLFQLVSFYSIKYLSQSTKLAFCILGLILCLQIPFQLNPNLLFNIMEYQREFPVFSLFGIMIWFVIISDEFRDTKYTLYSAIVASMVVIYRYVTIFHIIGLFSIYITILLCRSFRRYINHTAIVKEEINLVRNIILFLVVLASSISYPLYLARKALLSHYFEGVITGKRDEAFISLYQQGVKSFFEQVIYYPNVIINVFVGKWFINLVILLIVFFIISIILPIKSYSNYHLAKRIRPTVASIIRKRYSYLFCFLAIIVPLTLLTFYPTRSAQMGVVVVPPLLILLFTFFIDMYQYEHCELGSSLSIKINNFFCVFILCGGIFFQLKSYATVGLSTVAKESYMEVARLYDDIYRSAKAAHNMNPIISSDFIENYNLMCGQAIVSYVYEHNHEILRPRCGVPRDVGAKYNLEQALSGIFGSDLIILSMNERSLANWPVKLRDPLTDPLSDYPFPKSIASIRSIIRSDVIDNFKLIGKYEIFNRTIGLFAPDRKSIILTKTVNSDGSEGPPPDLLFSQEDSVWHSQSPAIFPVSILFTYETPQIISSLILFPQVGQITRFPGVFMLEALSEDGTWITLLNIQYVKLDASRDSFMYKLGTTKKYKSYRLKILENLGSKDFITLSKIIPITKP